MTFAAEPFEARGHEFPAEQDTADALVAVCTAVNGFYYPGFGNDAIINALAWLRTRPDICDQLELGRAIASD